MWHFPIATSTSSACPDWLRNPNFANRPVRTLMPCGVAGVLDDQSRPLCRSRRSAARRFTGGLRKRARWPCWTSHSTLPN